MALLENVIALGDKPLTSPLIGGQLTLVIYCAEAVFGAWFFMFFAPSNLAWVALGGTGLRAGGERRENGNAGSA